MIKYLYQSTLLARRAGSVVGAGCEVLHRDTTRHIMGVGGGHGTVASLEPADLLN